MKLNEKYSADNQVDPLKVLTMAIEEFIIAEIIEEIRQADIKSNGSNSPFEGIDSLEPLERDNYIYGEASIPGSFKFTD